MRKAFKINILAASVLAATSLTVMAEDLKSDGINSVVDLSFRYRVETVNQDGFAKDAEASTMRTRAVVKTKWSDSIDTVFEFDDVTELGLDNFNSGKGTSSANRAQYPIIADPVGTEMNQAFVRYTSGDTKAAIGRQRILVGNERFVGGVGWRQNEQTFDSFTLKSKLDNGIDFSYAYVFNVNRIFGETVDAGDNTHNTHLFNADYKISGGKLSGYYFSIDNKDVLTFSNNTIGIRYKGKMSDFNYTLELASQSDTGDNPNNYSANYYLLDGSYTIGNASFGLGVELLGGDSAGGQGFTTSLATLHKFQGWADVFLGTPASGINDTYLNASYKVNGYKMKAIYHDFSTDESSLSLGTELDFVVTKKLTNNLSGLFKFASFSSDNISYKSRDKVWLMMTYKL